MTVGVNESFRYLRKVHCEICEICTGEMYCNNFDMELQTVSEEAQIRADLKKSTISTSHGIRSLFIKLTFKLISRKVQGQTITTVLDATYSIRRLSPSA